MKRIIYSLFLITLFTSCGAHKTFDRSKATQEFNTSYNTTFNSVLSVLHSQGFMFDRANKDSGLILAARNIEKGNISRYVDKQLASVYVERVTDERTRISISIYVKDIQVISEAEKSKIYIRYEESRSIIPQDYYLSTDERDYLPTLIIF